MKVSELKKILAELDPRMDIVVGTCDANGDNFMEYDFSLYLDPIWLKRYGTVLITRTDGCFFGHAFDERE